MRHLFYFVEVSPVDVEYIHQRHIDQSSLDSSPDVLTKMYLLIFFLMHVRIQRGGQGVWTPPEKSQKYSNTGLDPLKNHKATKPAFNVGPIGPPTKCHLMAFCWQADDSQLLELFGSSFLL